MMGHREKLKGGDEWDVFTAWRKVTNKRRRAIKLVKQLFNRRMRRARKQQEKEDCQRHPPCTIGGIAARLNELGEKEQERTQEKC